MIKPIDAIPKDRRKERCNALRQDVQMVIDERITLSEVVNTSYSDSYFREALAHAMRVELYDRLMAINTARKAEGKKPVSFGMVHMYEIECHLDGAKKKHWYLRYYPENIEAAIRGADNDK